MTTEGQAGTDGLEYRPRLVVDALRHRLSILLVAGLIGTLLGYAGSLVRTGSYVSTASVLITPLSGNPYSPGVSGQDTLVSLETEAQVASSDSISALVSDSLGGEPRPDLLQQNVTVAVPPNTQIIEISYAADNAVLAQAVAQAYAKSFLAYRAQRAESVRASHLAALTRQQKSVLEQLAEARKQVALAEEGKAGSTRDVDYYVALRSSLSSKLLALQDQRDALESDRAQPGHVISPAEVPTERTGLGRVLYLAGGLVLALLAGFMIALARQRRDDRLHHLDEIESAGVPVLAAFRRGRRGRESEAEAVRKLRVRVLSLRRTPTIVVVGPVGEGKRSDDGRVALLLAESLTNVGRKVVVVDLVGGSPPDQDGSAGEAAAGITDLLMDAKPDAGSLLREIGPGLSVLPKGRADLVEASDFLDSDRMLHVITDLDGQPDYLVLRSPALSKSIGETLMSIADATIATVTLGRSTYPEVAAVRNQGERTRLLGCVLTPSASRRRAGKRRRRAARSPHADEPVVHVGADVRV